MTFKPEALIFDFDGVLADTEPLFWRAWEHILSSHNITLSWDEYCGLGRGVKDEIMLSCLLQLRGAPSLYSHLVGQIDTARKCVQDWIEQSPPIPAATVAMIHGLSRFRIGLVTSSRRAEVEPVLRKAEILTCFDAIVTADDTILHKPDPEPYLLATKLLGLDQGIAFEDSEPGLLSAAAAGLIPIRVDDPLSLPQIVRANLATFLC